MSLRHLGIALIAIIGVSFALLKPGHSETEITQKFIEALETNDPLKSAAVIKENKDNIPAEIKSLTDSAMKPETAAEDREGKFHVAELMARAYNDISGDTKPLIEVKKLIFESRLSKPVESAAKDGVHTVECPAPAENTKNYFSPDNIIIKKGEKVSWINKDSIAHIFSSMPMIGKGGIFSPSIEPGAKWEYSFEKPGEYYYICFIHKGMIGKVTVQE